MKTIIQLLLSLCLLTSCTNSEKKVQEQVQETNEEQSTSKDNLLKQNYDYTSLFSREIENCDVISPSLIAKSLDIPTQNVEKEETLVDNCWYQITLNDGTTSRYTMRVVKMPKHIIASEIKNYVAKKGGLSATISDTKDTYLCIHPYNAWLFIYNPNYESTIQIGYGNMIALKGLSKEQKEVRKTNALKLANTILNHHKK